MTEHASGLPTEVQKVLAARPSEPRLKIIGPHIGGWLVVDDSEFRQAQFGYATAWITKSTGKPEPLPDLTWEEQLTDGTVLVCSTRGATVWAEDDPSAVNPRRLFMTSGGRFALFRSYAPPGRQCRLLYDQPEQPDPGSPMTAGHDATGEDRAGTALDEALRLFMEMPIRWQPWSAWERFGIRVEEG